MASKNHYTTVKFSERLGFETAIRQWQVAANPDISKEEIETILAEIRSELCSCSSLDEVMDTMRTLREQARAFEAKAKFREETEFRRLSSNPEMKSSPPGSAKNLIRSMGSSRSLMGSTRNSPGSSRSLMGSSKNLTGSFRNSMGPSERTAILPGFALTSSPDHRLGQSTHKTGTFDLLDSPLLENIGQGESSVGRSEMRSELIAIAKTSRFRAGDRVVSAGSIGDSMFFISKGSLEVRVNGVWQRTLAEGECFGEVALATARILRERETLELLGHGISFDTVIRRTADVDCVEDAVLLEWSVDALSPLLDRVPRLECNLQRLGLDTLQQSVASGSAPGRALLDLISHVHPLLLTGLFKGVDPARVVDACAILAAAPVRRPAGAGVVRQGCVGETLFVVVSGLVSCRDRGREVCQFGPGRFFGELCLCAKVMLRRRFLPPSPPGPSGAPGGAADAAFADAGSGRSCGSGDAAALADALRNCFVRTADVTCLEDSVLIELSAEEMERLFAVAPAVYGNLHAVARGRLMEAAARHSDTAHQALAYRDTAVMEATAHGGQNETFIRLSLQSESAGAAAHGQARAPRVAAALGAIRGTAPPLNTPSAMGRIPVHRRSGNFC